MIKKCSKCNQEKSLDCFGKNKNRKNGYEYWCKECNCERARNANKTKKKRIYSMYGSMISRCNSVKSYKHRNVHFTFKEFQEFIRVSDFNTVYNRWVTSGYQYKLSPSVDRINNNNDYKLNNIQIITIGENSAKKQSINGEQCTYSKLTKKQVVYIRSNKWKNKLSQAALARSLNVSPATVSLILNKKTWNIVT